MGCLTIFLLCKALHEVELKVLYFLQRIAAMGNTIAQCITSLQHIFSQFYSSFNKGACTHFSFFILRSTVKHIAEKTV